MTTNRRKFLKRTASIALAMQSSVAIPALAKTKFKKIPIEEAFATQAIADEWDKFIAAGSPGEPGFRKLGETILADTPGGRVLRSKVLDLGKGRLKAMDESDIEMQVISLTAPGIQLFEGTLAKELAEDANNQLAAAIKQNPQRMAGLAAIAPQLPEEAAKELDRAVNSLGLRGAIVNSHTKGEYLDQKKYWPILEAANALKVPIYLHPRAPGPGMVEPYLDYGLYFAGWGFAAETSVHALRLIMSGAFDEFPDLKIILGHLGEGIPYYLQRIDNRYLLQVKIGAVKPLKKTPSQYFRDNFVVTTSGVTQNSTLQLCYQELGADRILFAADYPYEVVSEAVEFLESADLSEADKHKIFHGNAERLFGLS